MCQRICKLVLVIKDSIVIHVRGSCPHIGWILKYIFWWYLLWNFALLYPQLSNWFRAVSDPVHVFWSWIYLAQMLIWYQATYQRSLLSQHPGGSNRAPVTGQCRWMVLTGNLCIMIRPLLVKDALESRTSRLESPLEAGNSSRKAQPAIVPYVTLCQQDGNLRVPWVAIYPHIYIISIQSAS